MILLSLFGCGGISEWGNKIKFINELNIDIDSLQFKVCDKSTMLYVNEHNEEKYIDENPEFPDIGYPCKVEIKVYSNGKQLDLIADSYDCYHCDNYKSYILRNDSAIFQTY